MKTRGWLFLILAVLAYAPPAAAQSQPAQAAAWSRYTYPGEEFSVELPGMPLVFHTSRKVRDMPFESEKVRVFGLYAGGVVYMIVAYDKPRSVESDDQLAGYVWGGRGLTPAGDVKLGGMTGREYDISLNFRGKARLFRLKKHAYLLKAFSDTEGQGDAIERFLNSFAAGAKPSGELIADDPPAQRFELPKETPTPTPQSSGGIGPGRGSNTGGAPAPGVGEEALKQTGRAAGTADPPFKMSEVTRKAIIVYKPEPGFTEEARKKLITGVVRLRAILSSSGKVTNISVVKWLPNGLTDKAITAARHIHFFPAVKDGRSVSQYVVLEYYFNIY